MASFEQKIAAEVVRERGKRLLKINESQKTIKELEAERLYFWILRRLAHEIEEADTAQRSLKLVVEEVYPFEKNETILITAHGDMSTYHSRYVYGKDFNDVLTRVKCSISSMDGYSSYVLQPHNDHQKATMIVSIEL